MERSVGWFKTGLMSDDEARHALSHELWVPFVQLETADIDPRALELLPEPLCRMHNLAAYRLKGETLEVALLNLDDLDALEPLRATLPYKLAPRLTTRESLRRALLIYQKTLKDSFGSQLLRETDGARVLEALLRHALNQRAGEALIESGPHGTLVRYRHGRALR